MSTDDRPSNVVAQLRELDRMYPANPLSTGRLYREAADEIERLRARYEFLRDCVWQGKTIITRVDPDAHLRVQSLEEWEARLDAYLAERRPAAETSEPR